MKKLLMSALVALLVLSGCGSKSSTAPVESSSAEESTTVVESTVEESGASGAAKAGGLDTNTYVYYTTAFPTQYDYVLTNRSADGSLNGNLQGSLLYYNYYGIPTGDLAESWSHSDDYTEWTFNIRKGMNWMTVDGEEYAPITAHDWVTAVQHAADFNSALISLLEPWLVNLTDYEAGTVDFDAVGVHADDDYTLRYTLKSPCTFYESLVKYIIFTPVNQGFLESKGEGCKLGAPEQSSCNYANGDVDAELYSGAYVMAARDEYQITLNKNPGYWGAENVYCDTVKYMYYDGTDLQTVFSEFDNGNYTFIQLNASNASVISLAEQYYADEIYTTIPNETSYFMNFNVNRRAYANVNDDTIGVSNHTEESAANTKAALLNKNFRKAVRAGFSGKDYLLVSYLEEYAANSLRNVVTPVDFVQTSDGTNYGDLVAKYLDEMGSSYAGKDLADGHDAYFSLEEAKTYAEAAKAELEAEGVTFPVVVEVVTCEANATTLGQATVFKQCMEELNEYLGWDFVDPQMILEPTSSDYYYAGYYIENGDQANFDIYLGTGWGPDYYDPQTYLNCFEANNGDLLLLYGLNYTSTEDTKDESDYAAMKATGWDVYQAAYEAALAETTNPDARYEAMAKAEAIWLDDCISAPISCGGNLLYISRVIPTSWTTHTSGKFQYVQIADHAIGSAERAQLKADWEAAYAAAQAEYYSK